MFLALIARLQGCKSLCWPKKFDLIHQPVLPHERVGSGDETTPMHQCYN